MTNKQAELIAREILDKNTSIDEIEAVYKRIVLSVAKEFNISYDVSEIIVENILDIHSVFEGI